MFSAQGHLDIQPKDFLKMAQEAPRKLVNNYLLAGTPHLFATYDEYCAFRGDLASKLRIHPCTILVRGSARFGYRTSPRADKVWTPITPDSDIDVAIADVDYFNHLDAEVREWEARQRMPHPAHPSFRPYAQRQQYRSFNCVADSWLPPNTCVSHGDTMSEFDTMAYCGRKRKVSAFVFRDWWSLRNRFEFDIAELCSRVNAGALPPPP